MLLFLCSLRVGYIITLFLFVGDEEETYRRSKDIVHFAVSTLMQTQASLLWSKKIKSK